MITHQVQSLNAILSDGFEDCLEIELRMNNHGISSAKQHMSEQESIDMAERKKSQANLCLVFVSESLVGDRLSNVSNQSHVSDLGQFLATLSVERYSEAGGKTSPEFLMCHS